MVSYINKLHGWIEEPLLAIDRYLEANGIIQIAGKLEKFSKVVIVVACRQLSLMLL